MTGKKKCGKKAANKESRRSPDSNLAVRTRDCAPLASRAGEVCHFHGGSVQRSRFFESPRWSKNLEQKIKQGTAREGSYALSHCFVGAGRGGRTHTVSLPPDFESQKSPFWNCALQKNPCKNNVIRYRTVSFGIAVSWTKWTKFGPKNYRNDDRETWQAVPPRACNGVEPRRPRGRSRVVTRIR